MITESFFQKARRRITRLNRPSRGRSPHLPGSLVLAALLVAPVVSRVAESHRPAGRLRLDRAGRVEREPHADLDRAHGVTAGVGSASARCTVERLTPMMPAICSTVCVLAS